MSQVIAIKQIDALEGQAATIEAGPNLAGEIVGVLIAFSSGEARDISIVLDGDDPSVTPDPGKYEYTLDSASGDTSTLYTYTPSSKMCLPSDWVLKVQLGATAGACEARTVILIKID